MKKAQNIMTSPVVTVQKEASIKELSELFIQHEVNGIPVVDKDNRVVGMVTEGDLIEQSKNLHIPTVISVFDAVIYLESQNTFKEDLKRLTAAKVEDIYSDRVVATTPDASVEECAALMANNDVHTLPVIENEKLVGVIGKLDLIKAMAQTQ